VLYNNVMDNILYEKGKGQGEKAAEVVKEFAAGGLSYTAGFSVGFFLAFVPFAKSSKNETASDNVPVLTPEVV
jgi:hypothetical protein